jgi:hypothetical protein
MLVVALAHAFSNGGAILVYGRRGRYSRLARRHLPCSPPRFNLGRHMHGFTALLTSMGGQHGHLSRGGCSGQEHVLLGWVNWGGHHCMGTNFKVAEEGAANEYPACSIEFEQGANIEMQNARALLDLANLEFLKCWVGLLAGHR